MTATRVEQHPCPYCAHLLDAVTPTPANPNATPSEGDITVCIECACVLIFKEDLTVRKPTQPELVLFSLMPEVLLTVAAIKSMKRGRDDNLH
jgi:hypothetical protein